MNIYMNPDPQTYKRRRNRPSDGIRRVVEEVSKRLMRKGWKFVRNPIHADITVGHACSLPDPDVLHCHGLHPTADHTISHPPWVWETNRRVLEAVMCARHVSVPSPWVADIFARDLGFRPMVLRHGIDLSDWPEPQEDTARNVVLWNKNRARGVCDPVPMEILAQKHPKVHFVSTFGRASRNLEVTGLMSHSDMKNLLYRTKVYFAPTKETFGIGVLEALAAGCPVIGWNWGHTPHLIRNKIDGVIVEPNDHDGTSEALQYCMDNWLMMSKNARERAGQFGWGPVSEQYHQLYLEALKKPQGVKVSVIIPCYNYEAFVGEAIQSVKNQTIDGWECIVIDDGSTDGSLNAIQTSVNGNRRFRVFTQPNSGVAAARNRGAVEAKGEYLVFLDADDRLRPNFLELLLPAIEADCHLGIVYGKLGILRSGRVIPGTWPNRFRFDRQLERHNQIPATNMMRRTAFMRSGGFRQRLAPAEDAELWTRLGLLGWKAKLATDEIVYDYRIHGQSASSGTRISQRQEPDWRGWLAGANGGAQPAASIKRPSKLSHPVRNYDRPDVSIVIPVGDGHEDLVLDAIDSVAAQTYPNWELLVVDDTTKGDLPHHGIVPYHTAFPYAGWLRCGKHNASTARNLGAAAAKGKYLCFLDADDILLKDFLRETLPAIEEEGPSMVYTDWMELPKGVHHRAEGFSLQRLKGQALFAVTFLHTRSGWEEVGGFDESFQGWEDWDYQIALAMKGHCGVHVPIPLIGYRYDTGFRREQSLKAKDELLKRIVGKWKDVEAMPCRGCGRRSRRIQPPTRTTNKSIPRSPHVAAARVSQATRTPDANLVQVEFIGVSQGARIYRCPSGVSYRFGAGRHSRKLVRREDAEHLRQFANFVVTEPVGPRPVPQPAPAAQEVVADIAQRILAEAPAEAPPQEEIWPMEEVQKADLSGLKVGSIILGQLESEGWTLSRLSEAKVDDLLPIKGVGVKRAKSIIDQAKEAVNV